MSEKNSGNGRSFPAFQVKCALVNAVAELEDGEVRLTIEATNRLGKACEIVTGQKWYGFVHKLLEGQFDSWERKSYGFKLGRGIAGMYRSMGRPSG